METKDDGLSKDGDSKSQRFTIFHKIRQSAYFFRFHFVLVILSFVIPGILSFYDQDVSIMKKTTTALTIPLVLCHSAINVVVVLDNAASGARIFGTSMAGANTDVKTKTDTNTAANVSTADQVKISIQYILCWLFYDVVKIILVIIYLINSNSDNSNSGGGDDSNNQMLAFIVLIFLIFEGINFFITEFSTPRNLVNTLIKHAPKLGWIIFTMLLVIYSFAFVGYCLFKKATNQNAVHNIWIEGTEFDNIIQSFITMMDIKDWFNSYLIRAVEEERPGSLFFFYVYVILIRIIDTLFLAMIVQLFTDPATEQLILSIDNTNKKMMNTTKILAQELAATTTNSSNESKINQSQSQHLRQETENKKMTTTLQDLRLNIYQRK
jgi:hypothetical protein